MSILITGMKMPKEGSWVTVRIYPDGTCAVPNWQGDCTFIQGAQAVPVPPHGRLIDADVFLDDLLFPSKQFEQGMRELVADAPTVLEAEEVYAQYTDTAGNFHWCGTHSGEHTIRA